MVSMHSNSIKKSIFFVITLLLFTPFYGHCQGIEDKIGLWAEKIDQEIKKDALNKKNFEDIETVKRELKSMVEFDQQIRAEFLTDIDDPWLFEIFLKISKYHTNVLKRILSIHSWINISKFGKEADHNAWLLVQHADHDPLFQAGVAFVLRHLVSLKETNKANYAYLYDRVALKLSRFGIKQKYGTQVMIEKKKIRILPCEGSIQVIDKRRSEMGLDTMARYVQNLKAIYEP